MSNLENTVKDATSNVVSGTTELVGSTLNDFTVAINNLLIKVTSNQWLSTFIILFFVAYGSALGSGNKPPQFVTDLFKNPITRIVLLTIIAFEINKTKERAANMVSGLFIFMRAPSLRSLDDDVPLVKPGL